MLILSQIPKQLERNNFTASFKDNVEKGADGLKCLFTFQFLLTFFLAGILAKMALWVNVLQIITMMPLLKIGFPPISLIFLGVITDVSEFDFLDPEWTTDHFIVYDEDNYHEINDQFASLVS